MRLSKFEIEAIKNVAVSVFGESVTVSLFGSRINDSIKGGDIDLFIACSDINRLNLSSKIEFLIQLKSIIGDRKIDVILDNSSTRRKSGFFRSIQQTAVTL
jgi:predicted nucleotidyltransferase